MQTYEIAANDHTIQMSYSLWSTIEIITCDREKVSEKRSWRIVTPHSFVVQEDGERVEYEVALGGLFGYLARRNGSIIAERHRPFMRYLTAFGLIAVCVGLLRLFLLLGALVVSQPFGAAGRFIDTWAGVVILLGAFPISWWLKSYLRRVRAT